MGQSQKEFYVHPDLLCEASSFFKAAFGGNFKESLEKIMELPDDDEDIFSLFVDWLYHGRYEMLAELVDDDTSEDDQDDDEDVDDEGDRYLQVFKLFVLAEKYNVSKLKRLLIETLFVNGYECKRGPSNGSVGYLYEHTTPSSGIRKLVADWHAWRMGPKYFERRSFRAFLKKQPDFSIDLNLTFAKNIEKGPTYNPFAGDMPEEYKDKETWQDR